jgi:hypothetical protein
MRRAVLVLALLALAVVPQAALAASEFGFRPGSVGVAESSTVAGSHPDLTVQFELNSEEGGEPVATSGEIRIAMPPGLTGNPNAVGNCTLLQLISTDIQSTESGGSCPQDSQVGITEVILFNQEGGTQSLIEPIYNMEAPADGSAVARLGFYAKFFPTLINIRVRSESDYGLTASLEGIGSLIPLLSAKTTLWGVPADESHDPLRITPHEAFACGGSPCTAPGGKPRHSGLLPAPFLSNATQCEVPQSFELTAVSYAEPERPVTEALQLPALTGCGKLGFAPTFTATPTSREAAAPTGLDVGLQIPQDESVKGRSSSQLRDTRVVLPLGMTLAAGAADGIGACSAQQAGYKSNRAASCPDAAKVGSAEIDIPALSRPIKGAIYQRTPEPGNLFRVWLVADELGIHLALPGEIRLDPSTGQITSLFLDTPQAPVRNFELHFKSGPRAPLANPPSCGTFQTSYEFRPWSNRPAAVGLTPMTIDQACATGGFEPGLTAGSTDPSAKAFAPFVTEVTRRSGEQNISGLSLELPRGLLAKLAGVALCEGVAAQSAACPSASQVGRVTVASGPGSSPLWIPQPGKAPTAVYLSGPYRGAPFSLIIRVPAQAGPFDLGTVITRAALYIDPETTQVTVESDPLPQFLQGVPTSYRTVHVDIGRSHFIVNPTGCGAKQTSVRLTSPEGAVANAAARFRVGGCHELSFKPKLVLLLKGATRRAGHPALTATVVQGPRDANIAKAQVALPPSEFLDQSHIGTVCTRVQFAEERCPAGSVYGHATAWTPLLDRPLRGSVYLRSSSHQLPDLVADLNGSLRVVLDGRIDSVNGGIRSTFETLPDAPVRKFVLKMRGGKKGLLENSTNLCVGTHHADAEFIGHNDKSRDFGPAVKVPCGVNASHKRHGGKSAIRK